MAAIDVVPKGRTTRWLWILVTLDLAALLMVMFAGRTDTSTMPGQSDQPSHARATAVVLV